MSPDSDDDALNWEGDDALEPRPLGRRRRDPAPNAADPAESAADPAESAADPAGSAADPAGSAADPDAAAHGAAASDPGAPEAGAPHAAAPDPADTVAEPEAAVVASPTAAGPADEADDLEPQGVGTATLVVLGILGGVYLLYTVGWIIGGVGMQSKALFMLPGFLYQASLWVAVLAPALWFSAALVMTRHARDWVRIAALLLGALLLVPWPFVVAGGGGAL